MQSSDLEPAADSEATFVDSTPLLHSPAELRARAEGHGYLFFKQLLPPESLWPLRADLLSVVEKYGWLTPNQGPLEGRIDVAAINEVPDEEMREDIGVSMTAYRDVQRLESVHRLPHHPHLIDLYSKLFAAGVLVHPRHIVRMVTAHRCMYPTPPHQDFPYIQGTANTWTAWIPIGDCPKTLGGLGVLKGSHRSGYIPVLPSKGAGGFAVQLCPRETEWMAGDYQIGDVLTFPSHTVHKAKRCLHKELIRMSLDVRFQPATEPVDDGSLNPHCDLSWEEIYEKWQRKDLQYYWKDLPLEISPWDQGYLKPARRIC